MRKYAKYIVLSLSSVVSVFALLLEIILASDWKVLTYPETLIMPLIGLSTLIAGMVFLCIWGFKFSANQKSKKHLVISVSLIVIAVAIVFLGKVINSAIGEERESPVQNQAYSAKTPSESTAKEVVEYLQSKGYKFDAIESTAVYTTRFISAYNISQNIYISKTMSPIVGDWYSWKQGSINEKYADIKDITKNDTKEEEKQFDAYKKWLDKNNLTEQQIIDALDYYQTTVTEYTDEDSIISKLADAENRGIEDGGKSTNQ